MKKNIVEKSLLVLLLMGVGYLVMLYSKKAGAFKRSYSKDKDPGNEVPNSTASDSGTQRKDPKGP
jgi:hypothetical protein